MRFATTFMAFWMAAMVPLAAWATESPVLKPLWFVFLEAGKMVPDDKAAVAAMQRGHINNFKKLFGEKKLFAAGPLRDPAGFKRGIVVVRANSNTEVQSYFEADDYVREGYMLANAHRVLAATELRSEGIDPDGIEEVRIIQIARAGSATDPALALKLETYLQQLTGDKVIGAWYALETGPLAYVVFSRSKDPSVLETALSHHPSVTAKGSKVTIWQQWLGKGVVP